MSTLTHPATALPDGTAAAGVRAFRAVSRVVGVLLSLACATALVAGVLLPRVAGATPYTVLTGSMAPALPVGTLVVVRPVDPDEVRVGTVLTYQLRSGASLTATHRVVGISRGPDGRLRWATRGDANGAVDAAWVRPEQVRGELWYAVPHLGRAGASLQPGAREVTLRVGAVGLLAWSALLLRRWHRGREAGRLERGGRRARGLRRRAAGRRVRP